MKNRYHYIGCFIEKSELERRLGSVETRPLSRIIQVPHVTFAFEPEQADECLFGERVRVEAVGYGNVGMNEGLKVKLHSGNREIMKLAQKLEVPHITLSVGQGGRSINTRYLEFEDIEPFILESRFGGYREDGTVVLEAPVFVNCSNHPSAGWSERQKEAAEQYGKIVDVPFPDVDPGWDEAEVHRHAQELCSRICAYPVAAVMCQGEFTLSYALIHLLKARGIRVLAACSRRRAVEVKQEDRSVEKQAVFCFEQFREY